jgi:hypothetical protein
MVASWLDWVVASLFGHQRRVGRELDQAAVHGVGEVADGARQSANMGQA